MVDEQEMPQQYEMWSIDELRKNNSLSSNYTNSSESDNFYLDPVFQELLRLKRLKKLIDIEYTRLAEIGTGFAVVFTVLGVFTICINIVILAILCAHKRQVLQQVFYLLIINFAIIDMLKGVCLASHALRFILPPSSLDGSNIRGIKMDQYVLIFFRLFNLATVFNLLMITLNEFVFIKFPLRYHQIVRRKVVLFILLLTWIISIAFTLTSSLIKSKDETVYVSMNTTEDENENNTISTDFTPYKNKHVRRSETTDTDLNMLFVFALTGFCVFSLFVVLICYAVFFKVIRDIQKYDNRLHTNANRRMSETSLCSGDLQHLDERKIKRQLLKRYKYVLVIGSVILIYSFFLISYSSIQILQYFNLNMKISVESIRSRLLTRWILVLLCGLHSAIQPICYFRMREFREIVTRIFGYPCKQGRRYSERSEYFTSIAETATPLTNHNTAFSDPNPSLYADDSTIRPGSRRTTPAYAYTNNNSDDIRKQSIVHFEEGKLMTLSRRQSNLFTGNEV